MGKEGEFDYLSLEELKNLERGRFVVETSDVSVYVDGREAYDGQTSRVPDPIIFTKR